MIIRRRSVVVVTVRGNVSHGKRPGVFGYEVPQSRDAVARRLMVMSRTNVFSSALLAAALLPALALPSLAAPDVSDHSRVNVRYRGTMMCAATILASHAGSVAAAPHDRRARERGPSRSSALDRAAVFEREGHRLRKAGRHVDAEARMREALGWLERSLGPDAPGTCDMLDNLGLCILDQSLPATAREHFERSLRTRQNFGPGSLLVARSLCLVGRALASEGSLSEAIARRDEALEILRKLQLNDSATVQEPITSGRLMPLIA